MIREIKFKGSPLGLVGRAVKEGGQAPTFRLTTNELKEISLSDFEGKIKIITSFPSLDTSVCDLQVKEFNKRALSFSDEVVVVGISKDLPFAQKRFCDANDINNIKILSDYKYSSFGINYGVLIKELNLLARAILIVDKNNVLRYIQVVEELTNAPDYDGALNKLSEVISNPSFSLKEESPSHCVPCEGGTPPLPKEEIDKLIAQYRGWEVVEDKKIRKAFKFKDFLEAKYFLDLVSVIAQEQGHHPSVTLSWGKVSCTLTTHAAGGLTENDFIMARLIDELNA
ncbi:MAG: thiol peroxidase [Candidatus Omnitrophota bacterium]|nr:MAG: thiol peroxidase [Candidatus Omnitrophota bacterium]